MKLQEVEDLCSKFGVKMVVIDRASKCVKVSHSTAEGISAYIEFELSSDYGNSWSSYGYEDPERNFKSSLGFSLSIRTDRLAECVEKDLELLVKCPLMYAHGSSGFERYLIDYLGTSWDRETFLFRVGEILKAQWTFASATAAERRPGVLVREDFWEKRIIEDIAYEFDAFPEVKIMRDRIGSAVSAALKLV